MTFPILELHDGCPKLMATFPLANSEINGMDGRSYDLTFLIGELKLQNLYRSLVLSRLHQLNRAPNEQGFVNVSNSVFHQPIQKANIIVDAATESELKL